MTAEVFFDFRRYSSPVSWLTYFHFFLSVSTIYSRVSGTKHVGLDNKPVCTK